MPAEFNRRRDLKLLVGLWLLPLTYWTAQAYIQGIRFGKSITLTHAFTGEIFYCLLWICLTPLIVRLAAHFPLDRARWKSSGALHLACAAAMSIGHRFVWLLIIRPILPQFQKTSLWEQLTSFYAFDYGFFVYWMTLVVIHALEYYDRYKAESIKAARLEARLAQAQLQALKMQIQPHFLFNTLHTISALVHEDPEAAERMIARLSELLRISLDTASAQTTTLRSELDFLRRYLEIEQIRFEDRLEINFDTPAETLNAAVPNLILQPLVENAIRHGLGPRPGVGKLEIKSARSNGDLILQVIDNGGGLPSEVREGVGLGTTRARLECLYGKAQEVVLRNADGGGLEATLRLPFAEAR